MSRHSRNKKHGHKEVKKDTTIEKPTVNKDTKNYGNAKPKPKPKCHTKVVEVHPRIFVGGMPQLEEMIELKPNVLVPLDSMPGGVWDTNWRGEVYYKPVTDYGILPKDVLTTFIDDLLARYKEGKSLGIFCVGGHGRTGYIVACLLGKLNVEDPVGYLRSVYCENAIETNGQMKSLANFIGKPELAEKYKMKEISHFSYYGRDHFYDTDYIYGGSVSTVDSSATCKTCDNQMFGECIALGSKVHPKLPACDLYNSMWDSFYRGTDREDKFGDKK